jgi:hypothetical protein
MFARAAVLYFLAVFPAGVVLGVVRVSLVQPVTGPLIAVVLELPLMLALAWLVAGVLIRRFWVPGALAVRAAMGCLALALLLLAEAALGLIVFGMDPAAQRAALATPQGRLGLAGQILFGLIPLVRRHR